MPGRRARRTPYRPVDLALTVAAAWALGLAADLVRLTIRDRPR